MKATHQDTALFLTSEISSINSFNTISTRCASVTSSVYVLSTPRLELEAEIEVEEEEDEGTGVVRRRSSLCRSMRA